MNTVTIPQGYRPALTPYETQQAISMIKRIFADMLAGQLNLRRVSAPLFVDAATGLNDDLNGVERPVDFDIPAACAEAQVVQSLAKWKRQALYDYDFHVGNGLYTDMNAIRRDEELDNLHSIYGTSGTGRRSSPGSSGTWTSSRIRSGALWRRSSAPRRPSAASSRP